MRFAVAATLFAGAVMAQSTTYVTDVVTITSCAASVTNCPARSTVTSTSSYPVVVGAVTGTITNTVTGTVTGMLSIQHDLSNHILTIPQLAQHPLPTAPADSPTAACPLKLQQPKPLKPQSPSSPLPSTPAQPPCPASWSQLKSQPAPSLPHQPQPAPLPPSHQRTPLPQQSAAHPSSLAQLQLSAAALPLLVLLPWLLSSYKSYNHYGCVTASIHLQSAYPLSLK
jgi:hypothetical protein